MLDILCKKNIQSIGYFAHDKLCKCAQLLHQIKVIELEIQLC